MPQPPKVGEVRSNGSETRMWTGAGWQLVPTGGGDDSGRVGFTLPPTTPSGRTDAQDLSTFRRLLTTAGAIAAPFAGPEGVAARLALASIGGASGAAVGHAMDPHPDSSLGGDVAEGGMEGFGLEALPAALSKTLKTVGTGLGWLGEKFNVGSPWMRGLAAREMGMPGPVVAGAVAGPPVAKVAGKGMQAAGDWIGPETTSQRLSRLVGSREAPAAAVPDAPAWWHGPQSREVPYSMAEPSGVTDMGNVTRRGLPPAGRFDVTDLGNVSPSGQPPALPPGSPAGRAALPPASIGALERATDGKGMEALLPFDGDAESYNIERNAPYGAGQVLPIARPAELGGASRAADEAPTTGTFDARLGMTLPHVPDFQFEAGNPDVPGVTIGDSPSIEALSRQTSGGSVDDVLAQFRDLMQRHGTSVSSPIQGDAEAALQSLGYSATSARGMAQQSIAGGAQDVAEAVKRALQSVK